MTKKLIATSIIILMAFLSLILLAEDKTTDNVLENIEVTGTLERDVAPENAKQFTHKYWINQKMNMDKNTNKEMNKKISKIFLPTDSLEKIAGYEQFFGKNVLVKGKGTINPILITVVMSVEKVKSATNGSGDTLNEN